MSASPPLAFHRRLWLQAAVGLTLLLLYAPIAAMAAFSFNDSRRTIVWQGFPTDWYARAWNNERLFEAFSNSLLIAAVATLLATLIGTALAVALWRFRFPGKPGLEAFVGLPIVIPEICFGVAMMAFFARIQWPMDLPWPVNLSAITIAHVAFCFPFVTVVVRSRLAGFDRSLEEASKDLGAGEWQTFRYVLLPFLGPGIIGGALLAFTLSLDDFVITFFTSGPNTTTFPVLVYSMVRFSVTPEINAASTVLIVITFVVATIGMALQSPAKGARV